MPPTLFPVPLVTTMATVVVFAIGTALAVVAPPTALLDTDELSGTLSKPRPIQRGHLGKDKREGGLPKFNYYLDESDPDILILRRQDGTFVAAFSPTSATKEGIVEAAMEDYRTLLWPDEGKHGQTAEEEGIS